MGKQRKSFSAEQKLQIIQEADQSSVIQTLRKHNLSHSVRHLYSLEKKVPDDLSIPVASGSASMSLGLK